MSPLRQKLFDAIRQRGYTEKTFKSYATAVRQLQLYTKRSPDRIEFHELQPFFNHLVKERALAPASCKLYWNGIRFFLCAGTGLERVRCADDRAQAPAADTRAAHAWRGVSADRAVPQS